MTERLLEPDPNGLAHMAVIDKRHACLEVWIEVRNEKQQEIVNG
jgi:hypothetical protein